MSDYFHDHITLDKIKTTYPKYFKPAQLVRSAIFSRRFIRVHLVKQTNKLYRVLQPKITRKLKVLILFYTGILTFFFNVASIIYPVSGASKIIFHNIISWPQLLLLVLCWVLTLKPPKEDKASSLYSQVARLTETSAERDSKFHLGGIQELGRMLLDKYDTFWTITASSLADQSDTPGDKGSVDLAAW